MATFTAIEIAKRLDALAEMKEDASDEKASRFPNVYPTLDGRGKLIKAGTRINCGGTIKRAAADLYDSPENSPESAPTLWEDISYRAGFRVIPTAITAGTAFAKGECGWWGDVLYMSVIDNNVWTPEAHASGWSLVDN